jgi:glycosyltransferase involved in cell wall biosynthesis
LTASHSNPEISICSFLVIPHYNDAARLEPFLADLLKILPERFKILVSDDGSRPEERDLLGRLVKKMQVAAVRTGGAKLLDPIFVEANTGKGGAIGRGWEWAGTADILAFTDADGAVCAKEILRVEESFRSLEGLGTDALFASRVKMLGRTVDRSLKRHLSGRIFATLVSNLGGVPAYDTQCGLKFVKADAYKKIAPFLQCQGFAFDVELCLLLRKFGCPIAEFPVDWRDVPGSKVSLIRDSWRMALEVGRIVKRVGKLDTRF